MLDPRIYRAGFVAVALAIVAVAFSLLDQQGPLEASLAPDAFSGQSAYATMNSLARDNPSRRPGSTGDDDVAAYVSARLRQYGYSVSTHVFTGRTVDGERTLETVSGVRTGTSSGSIVVVSHRDSLSTPGAADLSGTAALIELARVLAGETQHRSIVLVSTSGSAGLAGATEVARTIAGPVDGVIALGDLAGTQVHEPMIVPWSSSDEVAPPTLRNTLAAALSAQAALKPGGTSLGGQLAHLAFPLSTGEQAPFGASGIPAVTISTSGDHPPADGEPTSSDQLNATGRTVLQAIDALDGGPNLPAASPYLLLSGKVVPAWAIKVLVLALILPVLLATVDGLARVRRRGHSATAGLLWVLAGAIPFALAALLAVAARFTGILPAAPPGPVPAGAIPMHAGGIALLVVVALVILGGLYAVHRAFSAHSAAGTEAGIDPGRSIAVLIVLLAATLVIWFVNPFAALLLVPALHLWMWVVEPELRPRRATCLALFAVGLAPLVLVALYYASTQSLGPLAVAWNGLLLVAGGHIGIVAALVWSVVLAACVAAVALGLRSVSRPRPEDAPVTVRGPITYAGPGSLGGTESALRR